MRMLIVVLLLVGWPAALTAESPEPPAPEAEARRLAELRERTARIHELEAARIGAESAHRQELHERFEELRADAALGLPPRDSDRPRRVDDAYLAAHAHLATLRDHLDIHAAAADKIRRGERPPGAASDDGEPSPARQDAAAALAAALEQRDSHLIAERDALYALLADTKKQRRRLRGEASRSAEREVERTFFAELAREVSEGPEVVAAEVRRGLELGALLGDLSLVETLLSRGLGIVLAVLAWLLLRRRGGGWLEHGFAAIRRSRRRARRRGRTTALDRWGLEGDMGALSGPAARAVRALTDAAAAALLYGLVADRAPLLGLPLLLLFAAALWRLAPQAVILAVALPWERRPALVAMTEAERRRLRRSLQAVLGWALALLLLHTLALGVLDGDRLRDTVSLAGSAAALALAGLLLLRWAPALRQGVATVEPRGRLGAWLAEPAPGWLSRLPRAGLAASYLSARAIALWILGWLERRGRLPWLGVALARRDLQGAESRRLPLAESDRQAIAGAEAPWVPPREIADQLSETFDAWRTETRRGLVAVVGDRGSGKSRFLGEVPTLLADRAGDLEIVRAALETPIRDPDQALAWLTAAAGVDSAAPGEPAMLRERLLAGLAAAPPRLFLIDDLHRLLLRTVGGFDALRTILRTLRDASERHFWVVSFHAPAWSYLEGVAVDVNLDLFRRHLRLPPLASDELAAWLVERTRRAGFEPDFTRLAREGLRSSDPRRDVDRATSAYWHLLTDASTGNPAIAQGFWLDSLCRGRSAAEVTVKLFAEPAVGEVESLRDGELFVLTALLLHGALADDDLSESLNLPAAAVHASCRHLETLGMLRRGDAYSIAPAWRPAVERVLRQKHFLHRG